MLTNGDAASFRQGAEADGQQRRLARTTRYRDHDSSKVSRQSKDRSSHVSWEFVFRQIGKSQFGYVRPKTEDLVSYCHIKREYPPSPADATLRGRPAY